MSKYQIQFKILGEIRMGSPFNGANVSVTGGFVPDFLNYTFQDKGVVSEDGKTCFLVQWQIEDGEPGYIIWKISDYDKTVKTSKKIAGCCKDLFLDGETLKAVNWQWDLVSKKEKIEEFVVDF